MKKTESSGFAKSLMKFFLNHRHPSEMLGDYEEEYRETALKKGILTAKIWWYIQIIILIPGFFKNSIYWSFTMFKNYLKTTIRNIKRQKVFSFINVSGLAIGLACCTLVLIWLSDELNFDKFHKNYSNIARAISVKHTSDGDFKQVNTPNALGQVLKDKFPEVINFARYRGGFTGWDLRYKDNVFVHDKLGTADPSFFEIFSFPFVKGDPKTALTDRYSIVITETMAEKYFGNEDPIGKIIYKSQTGLKVTGVIKDIPSNSHMQFDYMFPISNMQAWWHEDMENWQRERFYTYVLLQKGTSPEKFSEKISNIVRENNPESNTSIYLQKFSDIHLRSAGLQWDGDNKGKGNIVYVYIFTLTAICILLIACINFINLSTARSSLRAREIGIRKVTGAYKTNIIKQFIGESVMFSVLALVFGLVIVFLVLPVFNSLTGKQFSFETFADFKVISGLLGITLLTGLVSGSYPALFLSSFQPVNVLKSGSVLRLSGGGVLRKVLVIFQFAVTVIIILVSLVIYSQLKYINSKDLGFNKDYVVHFFGYGRFHNEYEVTKSEILKNMNVLCMSRSTPPKGQPWGIRGYSWEGKNPADDIMLYPVDVDYDYLKVFDMKLAEGRFFSRDYSTDVNSVVINETAAEILGKGSPVGKILKHGDIERKIIGIVRDYHVGSMHDKIPPVILTLKTEDWPFYCVKISSRDVPETLEFLEKKYNEFVPGRPFTYQFVDEIIDNFYRMEKKTMEIFKYLSILTIFIACLGLFGLAAFMANQKTKEIGIRKVLGAPVLNIILLLSKEFTKWILISNIVAWPAAFYFMKKWLENFEYRVGIGVNLFLTTCVFSVLLTIAAVGYQAYKVANVNPVESLKNE